MDAEVRAELLAHAPEGVGPGKPVWVGLQLAHQRARALAHQCAVTSIGTDSAIEACYAKFNVPFPGY